MKTWFKFERKIGWPEIIAVFAIGISVYATYQSYLARMDTRILNKVDFIPTLSLRAQLRKIDKIPAHINIKNKGPVDAIQVQIQFHFHQYLPSKKKIGVTMTETDLQWTIDRLPPLKQVDIKFNEVSLFTVLPAVNTREDHYRILEIRLIYRREVDLKEYDESAFYFVNQEGIWIGEHNNSLDPEIYGPIKEAAFSRFNIESDRLDISSDTLHSLSNK